MNSFKIEDSISLIFYLLIIIFSFFQYKVKERHLLRPKKRAESSSGKSKENSIKTTNSANVSSLNGTVSSNDDGERSCTPTNNNSIPNSAIQMPLWQAAFPFFPADISAASNANF